MNEIATGAVMALAITTARAVDADSGNYLPPYSTTDDLGFLDCPLDFCALRVKRFSLGNPACDFSSPASRIGPTMSATRYGPPGSSSMPSMRHQSVEGDESPSRTAEVGASCGNALRRHRDRVH
jgi:hypothetical protein